MNQLLQRFSRAVFDDVELGTSVIKSTAVSAVNVTSSSDNDRDNDKSNDSIITNEVVPPSPQPTKQQDPIRLWGMKIDGRYSEKALFWFLAIGALLAYVGFTTIQEGVFRGSTKEFRFGGMVTLTTSATYAVLAFLERFANDEFRDSSYTNSKFNAMILSNVGGNSGGNVGAIIGGNDFNIFRRRAKLRDYFILATMTSGGMYLTNFSLSYINYTTRIVAKCSKVIPTMVMGAFMQGRKYSSADYFAAMTLVCGVCLFALGDAASLPQFQPKGVIMIICALFIEATAGNFEERRLFNVSLPASHAEVVMHANIIGFVLTASGMTMNGEIWPIINYMSLHHDVVLRAMLAATFGYLSVSFILLSIRQYGATNTEIIKALRKMLSIALSLILYPKPMGWRYIAGTIVTAFGILTLYAIKKRRYVKAAGNSEAFK